MSDSPRKSVSTDLSAILGADFDQLLSNTKRTETPAEKPRSVAAPLETATVDYSDSAVTPPADDLKETPTIPDGTGFNIAQDILASTGAAISSALDNQPFDSQADIPTVPPEVLPPSAPESQVSNDSSLNMDLFAGTENLEEEPIEELNSDPDSERTIIDGGLGIDLASLAAEAEAELANESADDDDMDNDIGAPTVQIPVSSIAADLASLKDEDIDAAREAAIATNMVPVPDIVIDEPKAGETEVAEAPEAAIEPEVAATENKAEESSESAIEPEIAEPEVAESNIAKPEPADEPRATEPEIAELPIDISHDDEEIKPNESPISVADIMAAEDTEPAGEVKNTETDTTAEAETATEPQSPAAPSPVAEHEENIPPASGHDAKGPSADIDLSTVRTVQMTIPGDMLAATAPAASGSKTPLILAVVFAVIAVILGCLWQSSSSSNNDLEDKLAAATAPKTFIGCSAMDVDDTHKNCIYRADIQLNQCRAQCKNNNSPKRCEQTCEHLYNDCVNKCPEEKAPQPVVAKEEEPVEDSSSDISEEENDSEEAKEDEAETAEEPAAENDKAEANKAGSTKAVKSTKHQKAPAKKSSAKKTSSKKSNSKKAPAKKSGKKR